jgi:hypothetical protein
MGVSMTSCVRFWAAAVGVAGGSALAAAMIGMGVAPAAHADDLDPVPVSDGPLYAAYLAGQQLEADQGLTPHDLPVAYDSLYNAQLPIDQNALDALSGTESVQLPINNLTGFDALIFSDADEYFANSASDFSTALNGFESGDVTTTTALNLLGDDFQLESATNDLNFLDEIAPYLGASSANTADAVSAAADGTGPDVADLDNFLQDIGLGSLVTNNDFMLATDSTQSIGLWFTETSFVELTNLISGVDASTLTAQFFIDFTPAAQDLGYILNGTGDLSTELSQLAPDITQGFDAYVQAATELFLSA